MSSRWHEKKKKLAELEFERDLLSRPDDTTIHVKALNDGDEAIFEKKLTKEEKKAQAKAKRDAKKQSKPTIDNNNTDASVSITHVLETAKTVLSETNNNASSNTNSTIIDADGLNHAQTDALARAGTICTFAHSRKGVDARSRNVSAHNVTLQHMGAVLLDETEIVLNHGNRYGLIGRNGCGKSTLMKVLGARAIPIPRGIDIFFLSEEIEPSATVTALEAVMSVDEERLRLEQQAEELNHVLGELSTNTTTNDNNDVDDDQSLTLEEQQEQLMEALNAVYERLDALDASTAEVRARAILKGLGFTHEMQEKVTQDFSGGWRMRVSLARALFIQPVCLLLDEPTNHLDMEAVIWLEEYLSKWDKILLLVSHSQDFLNNVCSHMIHFTNRKRLVYYDGNYDQYMQTKKEKEENQLKQYKWEQEQIKSMKEYIARFGHGTSKNAKQAQSKEKVLAKMIRAGLTEKPEEEKPLNFKFPDPGHLPPPVLAFHDVSFGYPGCQPLYTNVSFGVDLDSRVALVGPNGAGKTTLIKLMASELLPTLGDIRPHGHLKLGRFTQHFVDVLDLEQTPLEFFESKYPNDAREDQRKYLGRFGVSGQMQVRKMKELSDGQLSRVVFAKLGRDVPHILLLDEPTNHLDMESIDALAKAVNEFEGGLILVSHDMRLISQVANEIWMCDNKTITPYKGDIQSFKMDMRAQMGIEGVQKVVLRGDASKKEAEHDDKRTKDVKKAVSTPNPPALASPPKTTAKIDDDAITATTAASVSSVASNDDAPKRYIPPHLRKKMQEESS